MMARRWQDPQSASDLGRLDPEAIAAVRAEAWPDPINAEELHDALLWLGFVTEAEVAAHPPGRWLNALAADRRGDAIAAPHATLWVAAERCTNSAPFGRTRGRAEIGRRGQRGKSWTGEEALDEILRGRLEGSGPVTPTALRPVGPEPAAMRRRSPRSKRTAPSCAAASCRASMTSNGATGAWSPACTAAP